MPQVYMLRARAAISCKALQWHSGSNCMNRASTSTCGFSQVQPMPLLCVPASNDDVQDCEKQDEVTHIRRYCAKV